MISKVIVAGRAEGQVLYSKNPINFLGAVDKKTGIITDDTYDIYKKPLKDAILAFPHGVGSSVGAYTIYSLKANGTAPRAMICTRTDITVSSGCALADIPLVIVDDASFEKIGASARISLDTATRTIALS